MVGKVEISGSAVKGSRYNVPRGKRAANKVPKMKCSSQDSAKWDGTAYNEPSSPY